MQAMCLKNRIKRIYDNLEKELDIIVIQNGSMSQRDMTFYYATGLESGIFSYSTAMLYPDHSSELLIWPLEEESVKKAKLPYTVLKTEDDWKRELSKRLAGKKRIGKNPPELTDEYSSKIQRLASDAEFIDVSKAIEEARLVKDQKELYRIKKSAKIASEVSEEIPSLVRKGMMEYELAAEVSYSMGKKGSSGDAFSVICAFGKNSAEPHYGTGKKRLKEDDFILLDFGATYKRYVSDITRTFVFGKASEKQKKIYQTVLEAQQIGFDKMKAGVNGIEADRAARDYINSTEFKGRFIHGLGHSIGLSVHDPGDLYRVLKRNMVYTVEPGIYIPRFGGVRIEDDVLIRKKGCKVITTASRELVEI